MEEGGVDWEAREGGSKDGDGNDGEDVKVDTGVKGDEDEESACCFGPLFFGAAYVHDSPNPLQTHSLQ